MFELLPQTKGANIAVKASGFISESDYDTFLPEFDRRSEKVFRFRLLLDWGHLQGWYEGAAAVRFGEHIMRRLHCDRIAILSDDPCKLYDIKILRGLLMNAEIQVFPPSERDGAWSWLTGTSV